jgi:hypothetical protein
MNKEPYVPTRTCPHRWCKPLHLAPLPFCLAIFAFDIWHNWIFLVTAVVSVTAVTWVQKMIHYTPRPRSGPIDIKDVVKEIAAAPSPMDLEMQDAKYAGTGWRMLEVRKGWARAAIGCDLVLAAVVGLTATAMFSDPQETGRQSAAASLDGAMLIGLLIAVAFFGFMIYAHKKATQPRKPKRAWLPAFLRTNV